MDAGKPILSLVVPLYCEGEGVGLNLGEIRRHLEGLGKPYEMILIDDGSTDDTWGEIERLGREMPEVRAYRFSRNFGKEAAVSAGLELAAGEAVIVMDADLQHPPELIPEMVRLWEQDGYHVVDAVKAVRGAETAWYRLSARLFSYLMSRLSGFDLSGASDFKLLDRRVVDAWLEMKEAQTFYRGMTEWLGFRHARLPMEVGERGRGSTRWSTARLVRLAVTALTSFSSISLHVVTILGVLFLLFAAVFSAYTVISWIGGASLEGFATVIMLQLIIGGLIMISLGVIGEYLSSIYWESKKRPRYILMDSLNGAPREERHDS